MSTAGGPSDQGNTLNLRRLGEPIPLPGGYDEARRLQQNLRGKAKRAQALRALAEIGRMPQWAPARDRAAAVVEEMLDKLPEERDSVMRDQLVGELKAWRLFAAAPDEALRQVEKLDAEIAQLQAVLTRKVQA